MTDIERVCALLNSDLDGGLANLGASIYVVQAVARHSRLQTTQTYLHTQQVGLAREAAELLDRAATRTRGKAVAKRAKTRN